MKNMIWSDPINTGKVIRKMIRFFITGMISALILHFVAVQSSAENVTLQWDTNDDASYYIVYYGTSSGNYTNESNTIDAPTTQVALDVAEGHTWYFSVKAFNDCGNSSDYSDEVSYLCPGTVPDPEPLEAAIVSPALNASINQGESINFLGSVSGGTPSYSYDWDFGDSDVSSQRVKDTGEMFFYTAGIFDITFTVTDGDGNTSSDSVQVTVQDVELVASIVSPDKAVEITTGDSVTFEGSYSGSNGNCTHTWDFGNSGLASRTVEDPGALAFNEVGSYTVTYTVTDSDGEYDTDSVDITVEPPYVNLTPTASIVSPDGAVEITAGNSVTFEGSCSGGNGTCTHHWDFGNSGVADRTVEDPGAVTFSQVGSYTVTYTVSDVEGDSDSASVDITVKSAYVNLTPSAEITSPDGSVDIIAGDGVSFTGSYSDGNGPSSHLWTFGDNGPASQTVEDPGSVVFNQTGSYTVTYTVTEIGAEGDHVSDSVTIHVYDPPSATITSPSSTVEITEGDSVTFEADFTGGIAPYTHSWSFGSGGPAAQTVEDPGAVTFSQPGTYNVIYTMTDSHQEYDSDLVMVTVKAAPSDDTGTGDDSTTGDTGTGDDSTTGDTGKDDDSTTGDTGSDDDSTTDDTTVVSTEPILQADVDDPDEIHWQISTDFNFINVVLNAKIKNSDRLTVPEMILNAGVRYFWRYRTKSTKAADNQWSEAQSFVTEATVLNDNNGNGIPDGQEPPDGLDLNLDGVADEIQPDAIRCVKSTRGDSVIGLMKTEGVVDIELLESIDYTTILDTANMPDSMPSGMIGFRVVVEEVGATVHMGVCFSKPIPEDAIWYKYDSVNGWQDYTANTVISDDRMMITVILTDGGPGDSDGIANGVIVDPSGIGLNYATDASSPLGMNADEEGCFIGGSSNSRATGWVWFVVPMLAGMMLGVIRRSGHTLAE